MILSILNAYYKFIFECAACGVKLQYGTITPVGGLQGEWETLAVQLHDGDPSYLQVNSSLLKINDSQLNDLVQLVA